MGRHRKPTPDLSGDALTGLLKTFADERRERAVNEMLGLRVDGDDSMEWFLDYLSFVIDGPPDEGLDFVVRLSRLADDDALCWIGVTFVEPLLDLHWQVVADGFEDEAKKSAALRKALSCASTDLRPQRRGSVVERRLRALIGPDEHVGR